jgi:hypothetical protein
MRTITLFYITILFPLFIHAQDLATTPFSTDAGRPVLVSESPIFEKLWETKPDLVVCESVLPYNGINFVSCINGNGEVSGQGYIAQISDDGTIVSLKWATGLDAPKGMGMYMSTLYVADLHQVVLIDVKNGKVKTRIEIPDSKLLNDIDVDENGLVAVSDWKDNAIYFIRDNKYELFMKDPLLEGINGVYFDKQNQLYAGTTKGIVKLNVAGKTGKLIIKHEGGIDGLEMTSDGRFITSDWQGHIYLLQTNKPEVQMFDLTTEKRNAADIGFDMQSKTLYIPTFFGNTVLAYKILNFDGF